MSFGKKAQHYFPVVFGFLFLCRFVSPCLVGRNVLAMDWIKKSSPFSIYSKPQVISDGQYAHYHHIEHGLVVTSSEDGRVIRHLRNA